MGPRQRFEDLFTEHHHALLGYAARRVGVVDAADVVAETFVVAWRRIDQVPADGMERAWLFGVARRVVANHRRGEQRRLALADRLRERLERLPPIDHAQAVDVVLEALSDLSDQDREVLTLTAWDGLSGDEIATVLGITAGAARVRLHRARDRLKAALAQREGVIEATKPKSSTRAGGAP